MDASIFARRLHFNQREYHDVLDRLESRCGPPVNVDGRRGVRYEYRMADVPLTVDHPEGGRSSFLVFGRNISRRGISVLSGGFAHPGSRCMLALERLEGEPIIVRGEVRHCRLFTGSCHEIGIRFDAEIDPGQLVGSSEFTEASAAPPPATATPATTDGTILVAESFVPDHLLLEHHLSTRGLAVQIAETPGATLDAIKRHRFDLMLFGLSISRDEGFHTLAAVRGTGYASPIILLTAETDPARLARARAAGATLVMSKPSDIEHLMAQIRVLLGLSATRGPNYSTASDVPGMPPLISRYVELVRRTADQVERTFAQHEWRALREYCRQLKGSGCGYGFQDLTVAAITALNALAEGPAARETARRIGALVECCRSLALNRTFRGAS